MKHTTDFHRGDPQNGRARSNYLFPRPLIRPCLWTWFVVSFQMFSFMNRVCYEMIWFEHGLFCTETKREDRQQMTFSRHYSVFHDINKPPIHEACTAILQNNIVFTLWIPVKMKSLTNLMQRLISKQDLHSCEIILVHLCVVHWLFSIRKFHSALPTFFSIFTTHVN